MSIRTSYKGEERVQKERGGRKKKHFLLFPLLFFLPVPSYFRKVRYSPVSYETNVMYEI